MHTYIYTFIYIDVCMYIYTYTYIHRPTPAHIIYCSSMYPPIYLRIHPQIRPSSIIVFI